MLTPVRGQRLLPSATTALKQMLNSVGAIVHPCLRPFCTLVLSVVVLPIRTSAHTYKQDEQGIIVLFSLLNHLSGNKDHISRSPTFSEPTLRLWKDVLSAMVCSHSCMILAKTFLTTSRRLMPLQLSPFLGMGTICTSCQSATTGCFLHTSSNS